MFKKARQGLEASKEVSNRPQSIEAPEPKLPAPLPVMLPKRKHSESVDNTERPAKRVASGDVNPVNNSLVPLSELVQRTQKLKDELLIIGGMEQRIRTVLEERIGLLEEQKRQKLAHLRVFTRTAAEGAAVVVGLRSSGQLREPQPRVM
ncbi:hypothetical protein QCA50_001311 [Cerrena zonata]|uniref:Uncharacterized protein n=1 Tax=Cerrena zonata TaxID=2478898 RepID=A0AAW0GTE9_9APHY